VNEKKKGLQHYFNVKLQGQYRKHNNYQVGLMSHTMHINKNKNKNKKLSCEITPM
jgi:hypothetical protein